jgi:hypothetical protein
VPAGTVNTSAVLMFSCFFFYFPRYGSCSLSILFCHHGMERRLFADAGDGLQTCRVAANILNKQSQIADRGWSVSFTIEKPANTRDEKYWTKYETWTHPASYPVGTGGKAACA